MIGRFSLRGTGTLGESLTTARRNRSPDHVERLNGEWRCWFRCCRGLEKLLDWELWVGLVQPCAGICSWADRCWLFCSEGLPTFKLDATMTRSSTASRVSLPLDAGFRARLTALYRERIPPGPGAGSDEQLGGHRLRTSVTTRLLAMA